MDEHDTALDEKDKLDPAEKFCATAFVSNLIEEGDRIPCDRTRKNFNKDGQLPSYYDANKFHR